jgi:hypothetical protein
LTPESLSEAGVTVMANVVAVTMQVSPLQELHAVVVTGPGADGGDVSPAVVTT